MVGRLFLSESQGRQRRNLMPLFEDLKVFAGTAHPQLAKDICSYLGVSIGESEVFKFSNDETFVKIGENIREKDVFLVQAMSAPVNDHLMEMWIMIDAARRASAGRITVVIPYYAYGRTDKKDQPRVAITARLVADFITTAGADRVLTMNLHAGQIQGFFNLPLDELDAFPLLAQHYKEKHLKDLVVVAADEGSAKRARDMGQRLNTPIAIVEKQRIGNEDRVEAMNLIGDVDGKTALIVEDEIVTGSTIVAAAELLKARGASAVYCCAIHPILAGKAPQLLEALSLDELAITDTLPVPNKKRFKGLEVVSVAGVLGEAIHRIHSGLSIGAMFDH